MSKVLSGKTLYNRSTDGWTVTANGTPVEGRAALVTLAPGTVVTLRRGAETEQATVAGPGDENAAAAEGLAAGLGVVLDGMASLRAEDRKLVQDYSRAMSALAAQQGKLADLAMGVASNTHKLNTDLATALGTAYQDLNALRAMRPGAEESWVDRAIQNAPQLAAAYRLIAAPLPAADPPKEDT